MYVAYYRVSTKKQGQSGLGLEAQRSTVARFSDNIVAEYTEVESGKKSARPQLAAALAECKRLSATLVVAKLDRLARNVAFTSAIMESGVEFVCCDAPYATRLTIHILAAIAEDEAIRTSARTKAALTELKAKGVKLGSARPKHWEAVEEKHGRDMRGWNGMSDQKKLATKLEQLKRSYGAVLPLIITLRERGESFQQIAETLQARGFKTPRGREYAPASVYQIVMRYESLGAS